MNSLSILALSVLVQVDSGLISCPSVLRLTQVIEAPGWEKIDPPSIVRLNGASFFDGHPSHGVEIAPLPLEKGGEILAEWPVGEDGWLVCRYNGILGGITQKATPGTTCMLVEDPQRRSRDAYCK